MSESKRQIPLTSGFILFGLYNLVIIGAGHGVATIGIMLVAVLFGSFPFDLNLVLLLLGWPGIILLFYEWRYAKANNQLFRSRVFFLYSGLLSVSIFGLIGISEVPEISLATAIPFFTALLFYSCQLLVNGTFAYKRFNQMPREVQLIVLSVIILLILTTGAVLTLRGPSFEGAPTSVTENEIIKQLIELDEYKIEEQRIDSLKDTGVNVELSIIVVGDSIFPEDSSKNLSIAFVEQDLDFTTSTLLIVKFDKDENKIVSVEKN